MSYIYTLIRQKLTENAKNVCFGDFLKTWSLRSNSVTRKVTFNRTKIGEKAKIEKFECDILSDFQTLNSRMKSRIVYLEYKGFLKCA